MNERDTLKTAPALSDPNNLYLCIGPHCWGRAKTPELAVKHAKSNRVRIYEGKQGWRFILFDARPGVTVDDMGSLCWIPEEGETEKPYRELLRYNM